MKKMIGIFLIAAFGAATGAGIVTALDGDTQEGQAVSDQAPPITQANLTTSTGATVVETPDFVTASHHTTPAVVHIRSSYDQANAGNGQPFNNPFGDFFGQMPRAGSSGSGVIISSDGYIATNNHVVEDADKVEVTLYDKRSYTATVIGTDPTTDLALIKIDEKSLDFVEYGNSDKVQVGEWVLAVGNPFNLTSTVTAGIVSAKGRSLNLLDAEFKIESFIQTDAAVNPGNSGGALVNTSGELVGINTAIASRTGSYAGYSFAVPSNLVRKVMNDIKDFGKVQRGIIGVRIQDINSKLAEDKDLNVLKGAYVTGVLEGGAASEAGIEEGDVIVQVGDANVNSSSELQEVVGRYRPGDKVSVKVIRDKKEKVVNIVLKNLDGGTELVKAEEVVNKNSSELGAELSSLSEVEKNKYGLKSGVMIKNLNSGILKDAGLDEGFVITRINKTTVRTPESVEKEVKDGNGRILIEGFNKAGEKEFYSFSF